VVAESTEVLTTAPTMGVPERSTTVPVKVGHSARAGNARNVRTILTEGAFRERTDVRVSLENMVDEQLRQGRVDLQRSAKMSGHPVTRITLAREVQSKLERCGKIPRTTFFGQPRVAGSSCRSGWSARRRFDRILSPLFRPLSDGAAGCAHRHRTKSVPRRDGGGPQGERVHGGPAQRTIGRCRPMGANASGRPGSSGPPGCGIPKGPHRPFGAEGVHRGSGASGPCESSTQTQSARNHKSPAPAEKGEPKPAGLQARGTAPRTRS
jgi:hypothetical protein